MIECYIDGACEPFNPGGTATYGIVIYQNDEKIKEISSIYARNSTNNVAEYAGLHNCLLALLSLNLQSEEIVILSDSQLLVQQMSGRWRAKNGAYLSVYKECKKLMPAFENIRFQWIPREQNFEADELSRAALIF